MLSRERIAALLQFKEPDRIGLDDRYWVETLSRWYEEGLPADKEPSDYFGFDFDRIYMDASLRFPERILDETDEYTIREDKHGYTAKVWKKKSGLGYLDHRIKNRKDWEKHKHRLAVGFGSECRINTISYFEPFVVYPSWKEMRVRFKRLRKRGKLIYLVVYGPFEATWRKHGFESTLMDMVLEPSFVSDMFSTHTDLMIGTVQEALDQGIGPDGLFLVEDLGYGDGMFFSPQVYREMLFPLHKRLGDFCEKKEIFYFMHSDGCIRAVIPLFIEAGVKVLQPLEAKAGLDVRELKKEFGRDLAFMGNIDVRKMAGSRDEIEEEVRSKILIAKKGGGYIYHSDHSVPPDVSFDKYVHLTNLVAKYGRY